MSAPKAPPMTSLGRGGKRRWRRERYHEPTVTYYETGSRREPGAVVMAFGGGFEYATWGRGKSAGLTKGAPTLDAAKRACERRLSRLSRAARPVKGKR